MITRAASLVLMSAAILCVGGCKKERQQNGNLEVDKPSGIEPPQYAETELTAATVNTATAVDRMVEARCARAAACNEIGFQARFDSRTACVERVKMTMEGRVTVNECPGGVDDKALTRCLDAVAQAPCDGPLNVLDLQACGLGALCPIRR
jgi:hypothetical protein